MSETCRDHLWDKIIIKLFASSWYIFLTYIYDARSHLYHILHVYQPEKLQFPHDVHKWKCYNLCGSSQWHILHTCRLSNGPGLIILMAGNSAIEILSFIVSVPSSSAFFEKSTSGLWLTNESPRIRIPRENLTTA